MNQRVIIVSSLFLAHILLFISFVLYPDSFWFVFTLTLSILIFISVTTGSLKFRKITVLDSSYIIVSAILLYVLSFIGIEFLQVAAPSVVDNMRKFYTVVQPDKAWHFFSLIIVIIPGEEIFWRGYIQQQLKRYKKGDTILIATLLYAVAHLYSGAPLLSVAAIVGGIVWGWIYERTNNFWVPLLSHILFDLLVLVIIPLL